MPDEERIEHLELEVKVLRDNNKGLKDKIDEQSKEIEELKEENEKYKNPPFFDEDNYTENDKIKAKIEEIKNECKYCDFSDEICQELLQNNNCTQGNTLKVLNSLLEKE